MGDSMLTIKGQKLETPEEALRLGEKMAAYIENAGKPLEVDVKPWRKKRSDLQNRTLRYGEKILGDELGYTVDEVHHELCCLYFGSEEYKRLDGTIGKRPVRTTTVNEDGERDRITTLDCARMFDFLQAWSANEFGVSIPDPDPNYRERINQEKRKANVET